MRDPPRRVAPGRPSPACRWSLKILWIIYAIVVAVNLTVWTLVNGDGETPTSGRSGWPSPASSLAGATAGALAVRTHRRAALER